MKIILDGVSTEGHDETVQQAIPQDKGIVEINQSTELGESLKELNNDSLNRIERMSEIDMRSRLHYNEISGVLSIDTLVGFKVLPGSCLDFTRRKKRLSVSLDGKGRQEIVEIIAGKLEKDSGKTGWDKVKGLFRLNHKGDVS